MASSYNSQPPWKSGLQLQSEAPLDDSSDVYSPQPLPPDSQGTIVFPDSDDEHGAVSTACFPEGFNCATGLTGSILQPMIEYGIPITEAYRTSVVTRRLLPLIFAAERREAVCCPIGRVAKV